VARGTQHRKRRPQANARVAAPPPDKGKAKAKRVKHQGWEDELFFSRLRVHAKWVFVLLALVFALGFVFFGVGSGSTGISDVLQNFFKSTSSTGASASSLRKKAEQHPQEAKPWRDLSTKLQADGKLDDAIDALKRYTALRPKDQGALEELAGVYLRGATREQQLYIDAQTRYRVLSPTPPGQPASTSSVGKALASLTNPIQSSVSGIESTRSNDASAKFIQYENGAIDIYKKLAVLNPKDATAQLQLAHVAEGAGDAKSAVAAYERFLQLAPDDPSVPTVKKALKQLKAQLRATATPATTHK
jgi:cytochrome c-type biogenesis protein CcmH/NrfG